MHLSSQSALFSGKNILSMIILQMSLEILLVYKSEKGVMKSYADFFMRSLELAWRLTLANLFE